MKVKLGRKKLFISVTAYRSSDKKQNNQRRVKLEVKCKIEE